MRQAKVMLTVGVLLATASTALALDADSLGLQSEEPEATVTVRNFEFVDEDTGTPLTVVEAGDTVRWVWKGGCHSVTQGLRGQAIQGAFDSQVQCTTYDNGEPATTFEVTFEEPGTYDYHCQPHAQMEGVVVVTGGS